MAEDSRIAGPVLLPRLRFGAYPDPTAQRIEAGAKQAIRAHFRGDRPICVLRHERTGKVIHVFGFLYRQEGDP